MRCDEVARVSVESDSLNNSLANQISYYKKLINNTKGYEFVKVYYDKGISYDFSKLFE